MRTSTKMLIITLILGAVTFVLGPVIWPPSPDIHPSSAQLPYLIALSVIEALAFGFGVAFVVYGRGLIKGLTGEKGKAAAAMHASLAWLLISWWPHDNLHIHNALNINGLIAIEYAFHLTVIAAGVVLVYSFYLLFKPAAETSAERNCPADQPDCQASPARS
jgi:hypothetical protein